ncbi:D-beta-hydroxybutyrate dehydrogenase, mitochondrial [Procambarus clarkii]|uniref:D-beta-hydroxybutyrate dehydrogenase, mitochondrial n=1 Tax=Procambarus clarkii TaxID=6728 RepID=UPI001E6715F3|nr:D-beta-hydroxybutyrate dehydrogenase, mitochondrial-like [Procambarus clarkii]
MNMVHPNTTWSAAPSIINKAYFTSAGLKKLICREVRTSGRIVVITGCDSGIGYQLAKCARSWGWTVVATCLDLEGEAAVSLRQAGVHTVYLDFTKPNMLDCLLDKLRQLKEENQVLWCLVNNAAMITYAFLEWHTSPMVDDQVKVNLTGSIEMTRALLPVIRENQGRVVMVSSPAGQMAGPNMTIYCATKWGIEGFTQSLRLELDHSGTSVVLVRPCNLPNRTGILSKNAAQLKMMIEAASEETRKAYGAEMRETQLAFEAAFGNVSKIQDINDPFLIKCFRRAMMSKNPAHCYSAAPLVVRSSLGLLQMLPSAWLHFLLKRGVYIKILNLARNY